MNPSSISESRRRQIRCAPFALALLCFILPFVQVSCQGQKILSLTGLQLATGTEMEQRDAWTGQTKKQKIPNETTIALALLCAAAATAAAFIAGKQGALLPAIAGGVGFVLMLVAKSRLDNQALKEGQGLLTLEYGIGFIAVCILLLGGAIFAGLQFQAAKASPPPGETTKAEP